MLKLLASSFVAFLAAKKSHLAILVVCVALVFKGSTTEELIRVLSALCSGTCLNADVVGRKRKRG